MHIQGFSPLPALAGGALLGLAATLLWASSGKLAGVSGIVAGVLRPAARDFGVRLAFVVGLIAAGLGALWLHPSSLGVSPRSLPLLAVAGLLVGFGSRLGGGCTSGHGISGLSRLSKRSLIATLTFMGAAALTVFVVARLGAGS
jgi:uncharacterized protein